MCIWLPNWPSQRANVAKWQADRSDERKPVGPIVLYHRDPRRGHVVATANQTARRAGILPHMPLSQCGSLCPHATLIEFDPQSDREELTQLAEAAQCFSPIVGFEQLDEQLWAGRSLHEPQCLLMDISGIPPLFEGEKNFVAHVSKWFFQRGYVPCIAVADRVGPAWGLANYLFRHSITDLLYRTESNDATKNSVSHARDFIQWQMHDKYESLELTDPKTSDCFLAILNMRGSHCDSILRSLPIEALRIDLSTASKMHRLGIRTIEQLTQLPRSSFTSRFGESLLKKIDQLVDEQSEPIQALHAIPEFSLTTNFDYPTPNREYVEEILSQQLNGLSKQLERIGQGALRVVSRIAIEKNAIDIDSLEKPPSDNSNNSLACVLQCGLFQPSNDPDHLAWLLRLQLNSDACNIGGSYWAKGLSTQITLSAPMQWRQSTLFESEALKHRDAIAKLADILSARIGRERVVTPTTISNPLPEYSYTWHPLTGRRKDGNSQDTKRKLKRPPPRDYSKDSTFTPASQDVWRRPTRLIHPPKPLTIMEMNPCLLPAIIRFPSSNTNVMNCIGPERIESGWWHGATQRRDYYRIELANGVWIWCYKDLHSQQWMLHGIFD
jgi:protein ImuB